MGQLSLCDETSWTSGHSFRITYMAIRQSKRKLKIALIFMPINEIRPPVSATSLASSGDLVMDEIARRLARLHDVIVYCARGKGQQKVERFDGVEYRRMSTWLDRRLLHRQKIRRLIDLASWRNGPQPISNSLLWYRHFIGEVVVDLSLQGCDIVHIMNISQFVPIVRARLPKIRIVLHMHCQWLERLDAAMIERRINAADLVLGVSNFIAAGVRRRFPSLAQRCSHIYNGADIALFARPPGVRSKPKQLLFVGRLAPEKGVHILLDAFHIVLAHHPDAHLELIGPDRVFPLEALFPGCSDPHLLEIEQYFRPGVYSELLRAKVSEFPSGSVSFFNKGMQFIELAPHYHSASIFAFPSVCEEACPLPPIEAMASRMPVVATRDGPLPEIVEDGRSGLLVERSNAQALADAILLLLGNPDQRDAMAQAAFERASTMFSWDCIVEDLLDKYERLFVSGTKPGATT
jgi:glycosyltransferase involved in cell wall biosynthesis